jgi:hypothetical protein
MGAELFFTKAYGASPKEAFDNAVKEAQYNHGHSGYTGSIAEKNSYNMATYNLLKMKEAIALANSLVETPAYFDKWGPAGCIRVNDNPRTYLFFGYASS